MIVFEQNRVQMDHSDRKAMDNLMDQVIRWQKESQDKKSSVPNTSHRNDSKQSTLSSPMNRKKKNKVDDKYPKITRWLNKENCKMEPLNITAHKQEKKTKFERNSSFERYGIAMPSFTKIMQDQKKFDEHKNQVKAFETFDDEWFNKELNIDCLSESKQFTGELLDCKLLSLYQLKEAFSRHSDNLKSIMSGEKYSERHELFFKCDVKYNSAFKDLKCSTSLVVFTQEQMDYLLDLLQHEMDPEDKKASYFFKVLLPELCLLIFMDTHNMTRTNANKYLDERPLDN